MDHNIETENPLYEARLERISMCIKNPSNAVISFDNTSISLDENSLDDFLSLVEDLAKFCQKDAQVYYHPRSLVNLQS